MARIFINYRREDTDDWAHTVASRLIAEFGRDALFIDVDADLPIGLDYREEIGEAVASCDIMVSVIGRDWRRTLEDRRAAHEGGGRLDLVRVELAKALERKIPLIPLLVDRTVMPLAPELPGEIADLAYRESRGLRVVTQEEDLARLVEGIRRLLGRLNADVAAPVLGSNAPAEAPPKPDPIHSAAARWSRIEASLDPRDYDDFLAVFDGAPERFDARRHKRQLQDWAALDQTDAAAVARFAASGVFPALAELATGLAADLREQRAAALRRAGTVFRDRLRSGGEGPEMVVIPAGRFRMGSPEDEPGREPLKEKHGIEEGPQHEVTIAAPFGLGRYAVTRGEFSAFVAATGHDMSGGIQAWDGKVWKDDPSKSWKSPGFEQNDRHPVVGVSWLDAEAYCAWLSGETSAAYRLPSEAEWECACRAGTVTPFWWGARITPDQANYAGNHVYAGGGAKGVYRQRTEPVEAFEPNPWGLYQMHGNVWEWCADAWNNTYSDAPTDGSTWTSGDKSRAVLRGGSWGGTPQYLRSAFRFRAPRFYRIDFFGFRVARTHME